MMNPLSWRDRLSSLLMRGCEVDAVTRLNDDDNVESAIKLFQFSAERDPNFLLEETMAISSSKMALLSIAILFACAPDRFLHSSTNRANMHMVLYDKEPDQLIELVEILKTRMLGRGFGARPQKLVRKVMESWSPADLEEFVAKQPRALYALVRLVHPRYNSYRGELIRALIGRDFKK